MFSSCNPAALKKERLDEWPWLIGSLGHLRVVELANTDDVPSPAVAEMRRISQLHMVSMLLIGFMAASRGGSSGISVKVVSSYILT